MVYTTGHASPNKECKTYTWVPIFFVIVNGSTTTASFVRVAVVTSSCLTLTPSRAVIVTSVEAMFYPTLPPPWWAGQKDRPPEGQSGLCQGLANLSLCTNMNRALQTCSMYAEPKNSLRQTYLPAHRYWESTTRAADLVGARKTSNQIRGISESVSAL